MNRITVEIKQIDNGWLLSVLGCEKVSAPLDHFFPTFKDVLEYLKVNEHVFTGK